MIDYGWEKVQCGRFGWEKVLCDRLWLGKGTV